MSAYLDFLAAVGNAHKALPEGDEGVHWRICEGSLCELVANAMNLAHYNGHSIEECYAAFDGPGHVPASVPS